MKNRKPKTPVKQPNPWWGNESRELMNPSTPQPNGSALDLSSLPKLGQTRTSAETPQPVRHGQIHTNHGPIAAPNSSIDKIEYRNESSATTASALSQGAPPPESRIPLHLPYLDAPPNKPSVLIKEPVEHESKPKSQVPDSDKYGLRPLLGVLNADSTGTFTPAIGTEVGSLPPSNEQISKSFASPWAETSKHCIIPEYTLPSCYTVQSVVPQQQKLQNLTEETLFYIFYTMPRDAMQEAVAVELTNRNWRYHKDLKLWLTKDPLSEPVQQNTQAESGVYVFFDPSSWEKVKKEYVLYYPDIA